MNAIRAELVKLTTTWPWWGVLLIALAFTALNVVAIGALAPTESGDTTAAGALPPATTGEGQIQLVGSGYQSGYLFAAIIGTIVGAADFRHRTVTATFLAVPRRGVVAAAKLVVATLVGLGYGVVIQLASLLLGFAVLSARGIAFVDGTALVTPLALGVLGIAVWALIGVGFGLLLRNQVAAVVVVIAVLSLLDPLASLALAELGEVGGIDPAVPAGYTLTNASTAVVEGFSAAELPPWWGGLLVLFGWAVLATTLARRTTLRRDVT